MKAGKSNYDVGVKIRITKISDNESKDLEGLEGTLTHPFGCYPANFVGVYLDESQSKSKGFIDAKCNLDRNDKFIILENI
jgi:hypothetical protein